MNRGCANLKEVLLAGAWLQLSACQPAAPPAELLPQQRSALEQANHLEHQMQQQLDNRMQALDAEQK